jgi:hypothetical protein
MAFRVIYLLDYKGWFKKMAKKRFYAADGTELFKSKYTTNLSPVYVSDNLTAKLAGIPAISTNCFCNKHCIERMKNGNMICADCFAVRTTKRYKELDKHLRRNTEVLTSRILSDDELPIFSHSVGMVRFEAFADLNNETQVINYFNIARKSPWTHCALWTKNPWYIANVLKSGYSVPENLQIVYSSPLRNVCASAIFKAFPFVDKIFTVYDKQFIKKNDITINCGARSCGACAICYFRNDIKFISERKK